MSGWWAVQEVVVRALRGDAKDYLVQDMALISRRRSRSGGGGRGRVSFSLLTSWMEKKNDRRDGMG